MALTNFAKNAVQDALFGAVALTVPANYYMALSTTTISSSGSNITEPSGAGYARIILPNDKTHFTYSSSGCVLTSASLVYAISSGSWGTITNVALMDSETSGSAWHYTALSTPIIVQTNTTISFSASAITFSQS